MAIEIDPARGITSAAASAKVQCPNCLAQTRLSAISCPGFAAVRRQQPSQVGVAGMCAECGEPVFLRYRIRTIGERNIDFYPHADAVEQPRQRFDTSQLPKRVATAFNDALSCYSHGLYSAFTAMCRLTARSVFANLGENGKLRVYDQVAQVRELADIGDTDFAAIRRVLFESDNDDNGIGPQLSPTQATILLETMKDVLVQSYVRGARLRQALTESGATQITATTETMPADRTRQISNA